MTVSREWKVQVVDIVSPTVKQLLQLTQVHAYMTGLQKPETNEIATQVLELIKCRCDFLQKQEQDGE